MAIVWGNTANGLGKLGIDVRVTDYVTDVKVVVEVWLATKGPCIDRNTEKKHTVTSTDTLTSIARKYGLDGWWTLYNYNKDTISDPNIIRDGQIVKIPPDPNTFYYNAGPNVTAATNSLGPSGEINHPYSTEWSASNQTRLYAYEYRHNKAASDVTHKVYAKLTNAPYAGGTVYANTSYTVPKLRAYTIKFDVNGGVNGPSSITKYHGLDITIPKTVPTRSGYSFLGWTDDKSSYLEGEPLIGPGSTYNINANVTLTAIWRQIEFTIKFHPNGGTGAPSDKTKYYGDDLLLDRGTDVPRREYHNFLGWSLSPYSTVVKYDAGASITEDASVTLYAVWEVGYVVPKIRNAKVSRCNADGVLTDEGTYAKVSFDWECYRIDGDTNEASHIWYEYVEVGQKHKWNMSEEDINGLDGHAEFIVGDGKLDIEKSYSILVCIYDKIDMSYTTLTVHNLKFPVDVLRGGNGVAFGKPATEPGKMDIAYDVILRFGIDTNTGEYITRRLIDLIHPLGSVITLYPNPQDLKEVVTDGKTHYKLTEDCAIHPNNVYPGTIWERIAESFLWACDDAGGIGVMGGSKTKTLSTANLPKHSHSIPVAIETTGSITLATSKNLYRNQKQTTSFEGSLTTETAGSGTELNIMPPYVQVAMFRRVG